MERLLGFDWVALFSRMNESDRPLEYLDSAIGTVDGRNFEP